MKSPRGLTPRTKAQTFWRFFILWAGIIACPCIVFYFEVIRQQVLLHLKLLPIFLAPAVLFGTIGAAWMTFLVPPGRLVLAVFAGIVIGFIPPAATLWGLGVILPKSEATLGYYLVGWVLGMAGGTAGLLVGIWRGTERRL
jgi:hypothetical protein